MGPVADQPVPEEDLDVFADAYAAGAVVVDVRRDDEWLEHHVPGILHIPLDQLEVRVDEVPAGDLVHVICKSGGRSLAGAATLLRAGRAAVSVAGGTDGWAAAGRPVVSGPDPGARPGA